MLPTLPLIKYTNILCENKNACRFNYRISKSSHFKRTDGNHFIIIFLHFSNVSISIGLMINVFWELDIRTTNPKITELLHSKNIYVHCCVQRTLPFYDGTQYTHAHTGDCIDSPFVCTHSEADCEHYV